MMPVLVAMREPAGVGLGVLGLVAVREPSDVGLRVLGVVVCASRRV